MNRKNTVLKLGKIFALVSLILLPLGHIQAQETSREKNILEEAGFEIAEREVIPDSISESILEVDLTDDNAYQKGKWTLTESKEWLIWTIKSEAKDWKLFVTTPDGKWIQFNKQETFLENALPGEYTWEFFGKRKKAHILLQEGTKGWKEGMGVVFKEDQYTDQDLERLLLQIDAGLNVLVSSNAPLAEYFGVEFKKTVLRKNFVAEKYEGENKLLFRAGEELETILLNPEAIPRECFYAPEFQIPEGILIGVFYCQSIQGKTHNLIFVSEDIWRIEEKELEALLGSLDKKIKGYGQVTIEEITVNSEENSSDSLKDQYGITLKAGMGFLGVLLGLSAFIGLYFLFKYFIFKKKWVFLKKIAHGYKNVWGSFMLQMLSHSTYFKENFRKIVLLLLGIFILMIAPNYVDRWNWSIGVLIAFLIGWMGFIIFYKEIQRKISGYRKLALRQISPKINEWLWRGSMLMTMIFFIFFLYDFFLKDVALLLALLLGGVILWIGKKEAKNVNQMIQLLKISPLFLVLITAYGLVLNPSFEEKLTFDVSSGRSLENAQIGIRGLEGGSLNDTSELLTLETHAIRLFSGEGFEIIIPIKHFEGLFDQEFELDLKTRFSSNSQINVEIIRGDQKEKKLFYNPYLEQFAKMNRQKNGIYFYRRFDQKIIQDPQKIPPNQFIAVENGIDFQPQLNENFPKEPFLPLRWETRLSSFTNLKAYAVVNNKLEVSFMLEGIDYENIRESDFLLTLTGSDGKIKSQSAEIEQVSKDKVELSWDIPGLRYGVYELDFFQENQDLSYTINAIESNTSKWVMRGPLNIKKDQILFFKQWSQSLNYQHSQGVEFEGWIESEDGENVKNLEDIPLDEEAFWKIKPSFSGTIDDSSMNLYSFSKDNWFNPFKWIVTEKLTDQTHYALIKEYEKALNHEGSFLEMERTFRGVWNPKDRFMSIQFDFDTNDRQNWLALQAIQLEVKVVKRKNDELRNTERQPL